MVARLRRGPAGFAATALAVLCFGIAFGYLEAAVVVYLRAALEIVPGAIPGHDPATFGTFETVEIAREAATLVMIGAVGSLAGRQPLERLAWASVVFGSWDIVYYAGLRLAIGWPPGLDSWDVLFLIPVPWVGPVWAPVTVSAALVAFGLLAAYRLRAGRAVVVRPANVLAALAGGALVIASFLVDTARVSAGDDGAWTGWPLFWAGMALAVAGTVGALRGRTVRDGAPRTKGA